MSNYNSLKTTIDANIKQNGVQAITGQILNSVLNAMVTTLGTGYQFAGVATIATNPGTPDAKVFYIANGKGVYTNFGGININEDGVFLLVYNDTWTKLLAASLADSSVTTPKIADASVTTPKIADAAITKEKIEDEAVATDKIASAAVTAEKLDGVIRDKIGAAIVHPIELTYAELKALRDAKKLIAGQAYRVTDFVTTSVQANTRSAGHPFDIIVVADDEGTLNENAKACKHDGDTYFNDCKLEAWELKYCLDNDTDRFAWADATNGKGIIYRMIDEWNNDAPYDFKNIMYNGSWGYWAYTFNWINDESDNTCEDLSVAQYAHTNDEGGYSHTYRNIIKPYGGDDSGNYGSPLRLNVCVFQNSESYDGGLFYGCSSNSFGNNCNSISFGNNCNSNSFGNNCNYNSFGNYCNYNSFGNNCNSNSFGNDCNSNSFGNDCNSNSFGNYCNSNSFGNDCNYNSFGNDCSYNSFGNDCSYIKFASTNSATTKYDYYQYNRFGDGCKYILFKGAETASSSAQVMNYNFNQGLQGTTRAYLTIDGVRGRAYETKVAKNSKGEIKQYCEADLIN